MTDEPTPRNLLETIAGKSLASRLTMWPATEPKRRGMKALRDAMLESERKTARRNAVRRHGLAALLVGLAAWIIVPIVGNVAVLIALGPTSVLATAILFLSLNERVSLWGPQNGSVVVVW